MRKKNYNITDRRKTKKEMNYGEDVVLWNTTF